MFRIPEAIEILERTPKVLEQLLSNLSDIWVENNEGTDTWSPYDIIGHLIHGEQTDWISRAKMIIDMNPEPFPPFDREAQFKNPKTKSINELLEEFGLLRKKNLEILKGSKINEENLKKKGIHPVFGEVTLKQLLSTWVVHDLSHIRQIARVMAKQYKDDIGPWEEYLKIVNE